MKLTRFEHDGKAKVGALKGDETIVDLTSALADEFGSVSSMRQLLELGEAGTAAISKATAGDHAIPLADVTLLAPINDSDKLLCVGMNYADHCHEQNFPIPEEPIIFNKFASAIVPSGTPIEYTKDMSQLDFEVELAIVIGTKCKYATKDKAMDYIWGYATAHDVSERNWQFNKNGAQWLMGKHRDDFCPLSPLVSKDEVADINKLGLRCILNGESVQDSTTEQMIFKVDDLVVWISQYMTLMPGDIILTGTPPGVGCFRKPEPLWLKVGDVITCEIDGIGAVTNAVVKAEQP